MNKVETIHFMQKVRAYYPNFTLEDFKINEWHDRLKPYDAADVYYKFEQHLKGEKAEYEPKLHFIAKYLKTPYEKANEKKINDCTIQCNLCGEWMKLSDYERKHFDKCSSIKYLMIMLERKGKKVEYEYLDALSDEKFTQLYEMYREDNNSAKEYYTQIQNKATNTRQTDSIYR